MPVNTSARGPAFSSSSAKQRFPLFPSPIFGASAPLLDEPTRLNLLTIVASRIVEPARAKQLAQFIDATAPGRAVAAAVCMH